jgi:hypothetical protein
VEELLASSSAGYSSSIRSSSSVTSSTESNRAAIPRVRIRRSPATGLLVALPLRLRMRRETGTVLDDLKHYAETGEPSPRKRRRVAACRTASNRGAAHQP